MRRWLTTWLLTSLLLTLGAAAPLWAARSFTTGQRLNLASAVVANVPFTVAFWMYATTGFSTSDGLFSLHVSGSSNNRLMVYVGSSTAIGIGARDNAGGESNVNTTTAATLLNTWHHACAVFSAANSRTIYLNGDDAGKGVNTGNRPVSGMNETWIAEPTYNQAFRGRLADVGVWNQALTLRECQALAAGVSPQGVRRLALVSHVPLWGVSSPEPDTAGPRSWALVGSPALAPHAPVAPARR